MARNEEDTVKFCLFLVLIFSFITSLWAACDVCQVNQVACINSTSYYLCFGEAEPNTEMLYHCKDGFVCTQAKAICLQQSNNIKPSCADISQCEFCSAHRNYLFACNSRTTFQMCYGAVRPTGQIGNCPIGYVCDASSDMICVPEFNANSITCDRDVNMMTTTTTEKYPIDPALVLCEKRVKRGLYAVEPQDPYCKRYIYCFFNNQNKLEGREYRCAYDFYYDDKYKSCTFKKPNDNCI